MVEPLIPNLTETFIELLGKNGQWALESAMAFEPREKDFLGDFRMLSKRFPRELARMALSVAILRMEADKKFPFADKLYMTRSAFEQATSWEIAVYRVKRFSGIDRVFDLGCSIGGDTIALAKETNVIGVDKDPLRVFMAKANCANLNVNANFVIADLEQPLPFIISPTDAIFFDPGRRRDQGRIHSVKEYEPPLETMKPWMHSTKNICVKISPGVNLTELESFDCEVEFISLNGNLKETVLWFGDLKKRLRTATLLPEENIMIDDPAAEGKLSEPLAFIYEPDPAILRAGLVTTLAVQLTASQLDPEIAYLTSSEKTNTPFARSWEIEDWMPFQLKNLRTYLRDKGVGSVIVKKRGSPIVPEELIRDLRLEGDPANEKVVFLTQLQGKPIIIIAKP
ncbi:MAG: class I SAM-dependent methyltransferase [Anaerolineales bacterium]|nr:class I SAM-dependent methyltransferase [Anaerolineales bacterium]